jgi:hypothetical protein
LKARRDLESKLLKVGGHVMLDDSESASRNEASLGKQNKFACKFIFCGAVSILKNTFYF